MTYIDIHTHILPGLDDGPATMEESLQAARRAWEKGITTLVATPHVMEGVYENTREIIGEKARHLQRELEKGGCPLKVYPGAEYMISKSLLTLMARGHLTTLGDNGKYYILELPLNQPLPGYVGNLLFHMALKGYRGIIPHPERILDVQKDPNLLLPLIRGGALIQVTLTSLAGVFGEKTKKTAQILMDCQGVHLLATDMHGLGARLEYFEEGLEKVVELVGNPGLDLLLQENPLGVIQGRDIEIPEPLAYRPLSPWQTLLKSFKR